jgi:hypothetical protein
MGKFWKNFTTSFFFLLSSAILIVSEFTPWFSHYYSPYDLYSQEKTIIYLFPIISSGIIIIIAVIILLYKIIEIKKVIISIIAFTAQSLNVLFLIEIFTEEGIEINSYNYGIFFGIAGFALLFWGLFWLLIQESKEQNQKG